MSALAIHGDKWRGVLSDDWRVEHPSWDQLNEAIQRMDAKVYTLVTIQGPGEQHLAIGGGAGRYVVYATFDNYEFWKLLDATAVRTDSPVILNAGGQEGDYPAREIVDLIQAQTAARSFFARRELDPTLSWEKQ